ncbi:MAG: phosphate acyltransferase PlsX [Candidatus Cloacimonetes bacterium]|nr:phosphate acyltransferase PlsX [Candidatus Cloacimonadota bacterium]
MHIALDAYGSDNAPFPEVEGAILAIKENVCNKILLVGKEAELTRELDKYFYDPLRIEIIHSSEVVTMADNPADVIKKKTDSSILRAVKIHQEGKAAGVVSAGNTGAVMASSLLTYGRIKNVLRPALAVPLPTQNRPEIILDVGANVDCSPENLVQFALLGSLYSKFFFQSQKPEVALLNIGEESVKGNDLVKKVYSELTKHEDINFIGNIEGKDLLKGIADVVVCDGFVGNVMLKTVEGVALAIFTMMKEQIKKDWVAKIGALLSFPVYTYLKKKMDHSEYGGALLLGVNGITVISHGRANPVAIKNAIKVAARIAESGFINHTREYFERMKS